MTHQSHSDCQPRSGWFWQSQPNKVYVQCNSFKPYFGMFLITAVPPPAKHGERVL